LQEYDLLREEILAIQNRSATASRRCVSMSVLVIAFIIAGETGSYIYFLCGGDKSTQKKDIKQAKTILKDLEIES
jgi:hypothetical protein